MTDNIVRLKRIIELQRKARVLAESSRLLARFGAREENKSDWIVASNRAFSLAVAYERKVKALKAKLLVELK